MILVPGFCHLHRVVSSGHSKVVLDQLCPREERKLKKSWSDTNLNGILKGRLCFTLKATVLTCFSTSVTPGSFPTEAKTSLLPMSITPTWADYQKTGFFLFCLLIFKSDQKTDSFFWIFKSTFKAHFTRSQVHPTEKAHSTEFTLRKRNNGLRSRWIIFCLVRRRLDLHPIPLHDSLSALHPSSIFVSCFIGAPRGEAVKFFNEFCCVFNMGASF